MNTLTRRPVVLHPTKSPQATPTGERAAEATRSRTSLPLTVLSARCRILI